MNGQMKRYKESLENTPEPISLNQIQKKVDLRGIMSYAKERGMHVAQLSEQEKNMFIIM
ncbi:MAG: hypothetical protein LUH07_09415 [Lachnospiraceae bacterium]|nr:hypothetical protein [Lachnospiraceae bacterium]